jgi:hypothetical protein
MALTSRRQRPLTRGGGGFRDDRLFFIASDDTYAPKQYFDFFPFSRVQVYVVPAQDGHSTAKGALAALLKLASDYNEEFGDERWLLLDTDHCTSGTHLEPYLQAIQEARQRGIFVAQSRHCFELWLLLHHEEETNVGGFNNAEEIEAALRDKLGEYNKTNLKREHYPPVLVREAILRAERLDRDVPGGDVPEANTTRVYKLWRAILSKALSSQLPEEFQELPSNGG